MSPSPLPLAGRVALVTGANGGLGLEIAAALAAHGASVSLACRSEAKAEAAAAEIRGRGVTGPVTTLPLDLASLASVHDAVAAVRAGHDRLDLLINNAGLMAIDESRTEDGIEMQFGVNHLGHFALTLGLLGLLEATPGSRVVSMSSMGHRMGTLRLDDLQFERRGYRRWPAYFQSKLCNLLFTAELHRRLGSRPGTTAALAAHPGVSHTDLGSEGTSFTNRVMSPSIPLLAQSPVAGALPALRAATDPGARSGEYYGPRWMVRGPAVLETPSRRARRLDDAGALWDESERLSGVSMPTPGS